MSNTVVQATGAARLENLSRDELIELLESRIESGIHIDFSGKANARKLYRRVRPRVVKTIKKYSVGSEADQARNLLIEGDNLQAMATLFRERGQVDLILTDPPYDTGNDWRYNDRWEEEPSCADAGLRGEGQSVRLGRSGCDGGYWASSRAANCLRLRPRAVPPRCLHLLLE